MGNEMFQARLDDDFADRIHQYRDENHMNKSEAVRHLLRAGLDAETATETEQEVRGRGLLERLAGAKMMMVAAVLLLTSAVSMVGAAWVGTSSILLTIALMNLSFVLMLASLTVIGVGIAAILALERPLRSLVHTNWGPTDE